MGQLQGRRWRCSGLPGVGAPLIEIRSLFLALRDDRRPWGAREGWCPPLDPLFISDGRMNAPDEGFLARA